MEGMFLVYPRIAEMLGIRLLRGGCKEIIENFSFHGNQNEDVVAFWWTREQLEAI
jgi:hypothetical protein